MTAFSNETTVHSPREHKIIITGDSAIGKTTLLQKYLNDIFLKKTRPTIGLNTEIEQLSTESILDHASSTLITAIGETQKYKYWDLAGQTLFSQLRPAYMKGADAIMLCFSLDDRRSFLNVESIDRVDHSIGKFLKELHYALGSELKRVPLLLIGTKDDKEYQIDEPFIDFIAKKLIDSGLNLIVWQKTGSNRIQLFNKWIYGDETLRKKLLGDFKTHTWIRTSSKNGFNVSLAFKIVQQSVLQTKRLILHLVDEVPNSPILNITQIDEKIPQALLRSISSISATSNDYWIGDITAKEFKQINDMLLRQSTDNWGVKHQYVSYFGKIIKIDTLNR